MRHKKKSITPQREPIRKERKQTYMNQNDNLKTCKKKNNQQELNENIQQGEKQ